MCVWVVVLHSCWDRGFEYCWGQGCSTVVFLEWCVGSGLCYKLITCSEESSRVCVCVCMSNCVWRINLNNETAKLRVGLLRHTLYTEDIISCPTLTCTAPWRDVFRRNNLYLRNFKADNMKYNSQDLPSFPPYACPLAPPSCCYFKITFDITHLNPLILDHMKLTINFFGVLSLHKYYLFPPQCFLSEPALLPHIRTLS
jgi:hypothetical protein